LPVVAPSGDIHMKSYHAAAGRAQCTQELWRTAHCWLLQPKSVNCAHPFRVYRKFVLVWSGTGPLSLLILLFLLGRPPLKSLRLCCFKWVRDDICHDCSWSK